MTQVVYQNIFLHWIIFAFYFLGDLDGDLIKDNGQVGYLTKKVYVQTKNTWRCLFSIKLCVAVD